MTEPSSLSPVAGSTASRTSSLRRSPTRITAYPGPVIAVDDDPNIPDQDRKRHAVVLSDAELHARCKFWRETGRAAEIERAVTEGYVDASE